MKGIALAFFALALLAGLCGMLWGIEMAATQNHLMAPAHAHLNLLGWVSCAIFGFYYHLVPGASAGLLPRAHFVLAATGLVTIVPGIAIAVSGGGEALAGIGSVLTVLSMLSFAAVVLRRVRPVQPASARMA